MVSVFQKQFGNIKFKSALVGIETIYGSEGERF